jgi:predicted N-acetyltransferase YhbS
MPEDVTYRALAPDDLPALRRLGRRSLPFPIGLLMAATVKPTGTAATGPDGGLIGAMTLRTVTIAQRRWVIVDWAAVEPTQQGKGIGTTLGKRVLAHLEQTSHDELVTTGVDGYNSSAWNASYEAGLRYWPPSQQLRRLGWRWPRLLLAIPHVGVSTFLLRRPADHAEMAEPDPAMSTGRRGWLVATAWCLLLLPLTRVREVMWGSLAPADLLAPLAPTVLLAGAGVIALYLLARIGASLVAARSLGVDVGFRLWESGVALGTMLCLAFSAFIPAFGGNLYIRDARFNYRRRPAVMGKIMLSGSVVSLLLFALFTVWVALAGSSAPAGANLGRFVGLAFGITDTLLFVGVFRAFPAGLVWWWRRPVGAALLVCFALTWLVLPRVV